MRYLFGFICVLALMVSPQSASAQEAIREPSKPASNLDRDEWSDLQWLLQVDQRVEPERPTWPPPPPLSEGSWLRLEVGFAGMRVVTRPPPRPPREVRELSRRQRIGIGVGVGVALGLAIATAATVPTLGGYGRQ